MTSLTLCVGGPGGGAGGTVAIGKYGVLLAHRRGRSQRHKQHLLRGLLYDTVALPYCAQRAKRVKGRGGAQRA
jgi:hypothetical protein